MSRLTPEREAGIRKYHESCIGKNIECVQNELLDEIDALRRERDEAIVGAYRAAADVSITLVPGAVPIHPADYWQEAILDLTPQSALDAVERREREIAEAGLKIGYEELVKKLVAKWRGQVREYPYNNEAIAAGCAVKLCANELEAILRPTHTPESGEGK